MAAGSPVRPAAGDAAAGSRESPMGGGRGSRGPRAAAHGTVHMRTAPVALILKQGPPSGVCAPAVAGNGSDRQPVAAP